ncbi:hypothetical protein vBVpaMR16F_19 [Vibrio phage vB_VpaM_R16F]|nr:hypothetical protein vBVpaMR16F_19 [Vibrio phage vB_VpaM_R16F]
MTTSMITAQIILACIVFYMEWDCGQRPK